jgi:DDE_Tnp_1-associated
VALPANLFAHLIDSLVTGLTDGDASATSSLATVVAAVPDARHWRGRRHELTGILAIAACACLTGVTSYVAISEWAAAQGQAVLDCLGEESSRRALPCEAQGQGIKAKDLCPSASVPAGADKMSRPP